MVIRSVIFIIHVLFSALVDSGPCDYKTFSAQAATRGGLEAGKNSLGAGMIFQQPVPSDIRFAVKSVMVLTSLLFHLICCSAVLWGLQGVSNRSQRQIAQLSAGSVQLHDVAAGVSALVRPCITRRGDRAITPQTDSTQQPANARDMKGANSVFCILQRLWAT